MRQHSPETGFPRALSHFHTRLQQVGLFPMKTTYFIAVLIVVCSLTSSAYAQNESEPVSIPAALVEAPTKDNLAVEYEEVAAVRVLERRLLPSSESRVNKLELGYGVGAADRLALAGEPPVKVLTRTAAKETVGLSGSGLQVNLDPQLFDALEQIKSDLMQGTAEADGSFVLPFGIECADQPSVQRYLALFTDQGSKTLKVWMQRSGRWRPLILEILQEEAVPRDLLFLAMIESGFKTQVKSPANAGGMWQFIPGTALDMGLRIDAYVDERFDPIKATRAAAIYLKRQHAKFGSWPLAMAAYNGGAGTVSKAIDTYNSNDYFQLVEYGAMYDETRRYVPKIMAAALVANNPKSFGFDGLASDPAWDYDEVEVPGDVRLSLLADAVGSTLEELEELNPELLLKQTPPDRETYTLRIPAGTGSLFVENFDNLVEKYGKKHERITLRFGETIERVAQKTGVPTRVLREINGFANKERAPYGTTLLVPTKGRSAVEPESPSKEMRVVLVPKEEFTFEGRERVFYDVNKGDTLEEIADHFGLRKVQVALWNDLDATAKLREGLTLQLFLPQDHATDAILSLESEVRALEIGSEEYEDWTQSKTQSEGNRTTYKVQKGDSVSKIAKKFSVKSTDLIRWNNLDSKGTIRLGMRLVIQGSAAKQAKPKKKQKK
ncbi:MAG: hypothetical protein CO108_13335 [Deltaproteobacteria bacterium CG_4_9_14_3_um_filter_63_12]|nr:MAG: hypothetical protein CO108_13335 [Deltaproteobacteria bacterium CG_4_9_14_3_um_filter_63_12]